MKAKLLMTLTAGLAWAGSAWAAPSLEQISPISISFVDQTDFAVMGYSPVGDVTSTVASVDLFSGTSGCDAADFAGFPVGSIALLQTGACSFDFKAINASNAGAVGVLIFNDNPALLLGTLSASFPGNLPVMGLTQNLGLELWNLAPVGLVMRMSVDETPVPPGVPEPGTLALLGLGLAGLAVARRGRWSLGA